MSDNLAEGKIETSLACIDILRPSGNRSVFAGSLFGNGMEDL